MNVLQTIPLPRVDASSYTANRVNSLGCDLTRTSRRVLLTTALFAFAGAAFALWLRIVPAGNADPRSWFNVFYVLFARHEPLGLAVVGVFSLATSILVFRNKAETPVLAVAENGSRHWLLALIAVSVFASAAVGTQLVCHNYALTADENLADFQAKIFLRGKIQAEVPVQFQDAVVVLKPTFVEYFPATHLWNATYLPVYAAMRAVFQSVALQHLLNPFLAGLTIIALYGVARTIWTEKKSHALIAVGLLASSSQFLLMAMTGYAMPAHLALNTIWLWLYSRPEKRRFYLTPVLGVLALGLHQPFFHALFAAPFLFRLVLQRKWRPTVVFAGIYIAGCAIWLYWSMHFRSHFGAAAAASAFRLFNPRMAIIQPMNLGLLIGWSCLATPLLAMLGLRRLFHLPPLLQDAAFSCLLTFGFYYFFYLDQAHGWGYRYFHGVLCCLVLVAVAGWDWLSRIAPRRAAIFVASGVAISVLVQFPLRCFQAESFVRPFARTAAVFHAIPKDLVGFDARTAWYSADLLRNDPFLENRPLIVSLYALTPAAVSVLEKAGSAQFIDEQMLAQLGMSTKRRSDYKRDPFMLGRGK